MLRDLAVAGHGIARLPEFFGAPAVHTGALLELLEERGGAWL